MIASILIRFARKVVQNVLSQLTQQFNVIQEQAYQPMQAMVQQVMDGVWVGKGADAFVEALTFLVKTSKTRLMSWTALMNKQIASLTVWAICLAVFSN